MNAIRLHIAGAILALLFFAPAIFADTPGGYAGAFLELPPMASSVAFGGACLTYDPEPAALFWNPANLYGLYKHCAQASVERLPLAALRYSVAGIYKWERLRFGVGFLQHSIGDIQGRDASSAATSTLSYGYSAVSIGMAYGIKKGSRRDASKTAFRQFAFGMNTKIIWQQDESGIEGSGLTFDTGISGRYGYFRYGVMFRNIGGLMWWNNSTTDTLPMAVLVGVGAEYGESNWLELSLESKVLSRIRWRIGGQIMVNDWAGFRAGADVSTGAPAAIEEIRAAGGGVIYYTLGAPFELSYAVQYIAAVQGWAFSSSISWSTF